MNIRDKIQIGETLQDEFIKSFKRANLNTSNYHSISSSSEICVSTVYGLANKTCKVTNKNIEAAVGLINKSNEIFDFWICEGEKGKSELKNLGF